MLCLLLIFGTVPCTLSGCFVINRAGMRLLYQKADLPASQIVRDLPYRKEADDDPDKNRLNLFLPEGTGWPVVVFVHGGGWNSGDRNLIFGGRDIYGNIGRYLAAHGVGVAVISYRLLPDVSWTAQIEDVAAATAWVYEHIASYGGNPEALFLMGHSAGAQLATRIALDPAPLERQGRSTGIVCGVVAVSGAAYDVGDSETYRLGGSYPYLVQRFSKDGGPNWPYAASPIRFVHADAPPFLLLYAGGETRALQRQSQRLAARLHEAGASAQTVVVPGESHARILLTLSRDDKTAGPAVLAFIQGTSCRL